MSLLARERRASVNMLRNMEEGIAERIREILEKSTVPGAKEFLEPEKVSRVIPHLVRRFLDRRGARLMGQMQKSPGIYEWDDALQSELDVYLQDIVTAFLRGEQSPDNTDDDVRVFRRIYETVRGNQMDAERQRIEDAVVRDMTKDDLPDFEAMYETFRMTAEEAMLVVTGQFDTFQKRAERGMFIKNCRSYEYGRLEQYLEVTNSLKQKRGDLRFEHETVVAKVLVDPLTNEKLSFAIVTVAPAHPMQEPRRLYLQEQEELFEHGTSGGSMHFLNRRQGRGLWKKIEQGKVGMIWMIIRIVPGAIHRTTSAAMKEYQELRPDDENEPHLLKSYHLGHLRMFVNGLPVDEPAVPIGENTGSAINLRMLGQAPFATDTNEDIHAPGATFAMHEGLSVVAVPNWTHTVGNVKRALSGSQKRYRDFLAGK